MAHVGAISDLLSIRWQAGGTIVGSNVVLETVSRIEGQVDATAEIALPSPRQLEVNPLPSATLLETMLPRAAPTF